MDHWLTTSSLVVVAAAADLSIGFFLKKPTCFYLGLFENEGFLTQLQWTSLKLPCRI